MKIRRFLSLVLCLSMVFALFTGMASTASADDVITYEVQRNDYLFKICKNFGLDYYQCKNAIMILNGYTSELQLSRLSVGQTIKLPASNAVAATVKASTTTTVATTTTAGSTTTVTTTSSTISGVPGAASAYNYAFYLVQHTVQYGQTLTTICNQYGTSYAAYSSMILAMNGLKSANSVWAGKTIYVPAATVPAAGAAYGVVAHTVASGQTMTSICAQYGISLANWSTVIQGLNVGINLNAIKVGQRIYIPTPVASAAVPGTGTAITVPTGTPGTAVNAGYDINFTNIDTAKGTPYATVNGVNVSKAAAGSTVKIAGNSSTSYAIKSIDVYTGDLATKTTYQGNTFTMPACAVRVECNYQPAFAIVKEPVFNGNFSILVNGVSGGYALKDDTITIVPAPNTGYSFAGKSAVASTGILPSALKDEKDGTVTFKMPANDVKLKLTFNDATYSKLSWTNDVVKHGSVTVQAAGYTITNGASVAKDTIVTVTVTPENGYMVAVSTDNGADVKKNGNTFTFKMPGTDTKILASYSNNVVYTISADSLTKHGNVQFSVNGNVQNNALAGQLVTVSVVAESGYTYDPASPIFVRYKDLNTAVLMQTPYTFIMPPADVVVYGQFKEISGTKHSILKAEDSGCDFVVTNNSGNQQTMFNPGDPVKIKPVYDPEKWKVASVKFRLVGTLDWYPLSGPDANGFYSMTMPVAPNDTRDIEVKVELASFENWVTIKFPATADADGFIKKSDGNLALRLTATVNGVTVNNNSIVKNGSRVTLSVTVYDDVTFNGFTEDGIGSLVAIDPNNCYYDIKWNDPSTINFGVSFTE